MFDFMETEISGLTLITPFLAEDHRGYYKKYFECSWFEEHGLPTSYSESSDIFSHKGAIRGLHYQKNDSQGKLIHVIYGKIFDVALDLRDNSKSFGVWKSFILSGDKAQCLYIPEGFAHGFLALEETVFSYQCTGKYNPPSCGGIIWNDPELNIPWPMDGMEKIMITDKDRSWPTFKEYVRRFK